MNRRTTASVTQKIEAKGPVFSVNLNVYKGTRENTSKVTISKIKDELLFGQNYLVVEPHEIPTLIDDLQWAYDRWKETTRADDEESTDER